MQSISVITPVYNADRFLVKTIESVLIQPEVKEHILIDDGSTDDSWKIIQEWEKKDSRIVALQHSDKKNHGRSATRNVGLKVATQKYIAFLDADDCYLPNHFINDLNILENDDSVDGVYNAIGAHYYEDYKGEKTDWLDLTTMIEVIPPEELFESMSPFGYKGWFSGDGLTVRKKIFDKTGLFDENLIVAEDTHLWGKMALKSRLVSGILDKPVTLRGVHGENVFNNDAVYINERLKMYEALFRWSKKNNVKLSRMLLIWKRKNMHIKNNFSIKKGVYKSLLGWFGDVTIYPKMITQKEVQKFPFVLIKRLLKQANQKT